MGQGLNKNFFSYLGKFSAVDDATKYHLLPFHSLDVAAVAEALLKENIFFAQDLSDLLGLEQQQLIKLLCFFISLHDLGKFASAFQMIFSDKTSLLFEPKARIKPYDGKNFRHDRLGFHFWQKVEELVLDYVAPEEELDDDDQAFEALQTLAELVLGHHGKPINTNGSFELKSYLESKNEEAANVFVEEMLALFQPNIPSYLLADESWHARLKQVSWHLAGLTVLADWLGSNTEFFPYETEPMPLEEYWLQAQSKAKHALAKTDLWKKIAVKPFLSIKEHYGFEPTPLQQWAETVPVDNTPQLFMLEDITGAGKTEAALALTHRLMEAGAASGFYFGLPTMATSNAMFSRVAEHYLQMLETDEGTKPSIVLAHGARDMHEQFREAVWASAKLDANYASTDASATAQCNSWLADSRKKALLAPVGVGTIDQTLLAVLPRRHQSLRLLGMNRKVLIFDEIHSADEYMFELFESLLSLHLHQGGSAILLTATLSQQQRQRLVNIWAEPLQVENQQIQSTAFPLATKVSMASGVEEEPLASRADVSRKVNVIFLHNEESCVDALVAAAQKGECAVWVRNTVNDALDAYDALVKELGEERCLLFHSRFALQDRKQIEKEVLTIFGKEGSANNRKGKVLVATQVFQESLDADADLMISDICPIDDLIQRAGRLHRHTRNKLGEYQRGIQDAREEPLLYVHAPAWAAEPDKNWLSDSFQNTEYVYRSPGRLWLGMQKLQELGGWRMPEDARELIEAVYSLEAKNTIPEALVEQEQEVMGEVRAKVARAQSSLIDWQHHGYSDQSSLVWHEDDTDISTRFSDVETAEVIVLKLKDNGKLDFYAEDKRFALPLSTVKLGVNKYLKKMTLLEEQDERLSELKSSFSKIKFEYLNLWLPENDASFGYSSSSGVFEKDKE